MAAEEPPGWMFDEPDNVVPMRERGPSKDDPFRGLAHLPKVLLFGEQRILGLAAQPVDYVWQDIAVAGTVVVIAGPPAEGKTTLLFLILACRLGAAAPHAFLERKIEPIPEGRFVLLIEGEHSEASTSRKLKRSLDIMGFGTAGLARVFVVARKAVVIGSPEWHDAELMISAGLISDIAIDTLARVAPADGNDEGQQVAVFDGLARAIEKAPDGAKPTVWCIAHTRKNGADGGLGDVAGSVQRVGQADTVMIVRGEKQGGQTISSKVTFMKLREEPENYPAPVEFSIVKDDQGLPYIAGKRRPDEARPLEERALALMRHEPRTKSWLAKELGRNKPDIEVVITNLFDQRAIVSVKTTVHGRERTAFRAKTEEELLKFSGFRARDEARDSLEQGTEVPLPWDESL